MTLCMLGKCSILEAHFSLEVFQEFTKVQRSVWYSIQFCGHQLTVILVSPITIQFPHKGYA